MCNYIQHQVDIRKYNASHITTCKYKQLHVTTNKYM